MKKVIFKSALIAIIVASFVSCRKEKKTEEKKETEPVYVKKEVEEEIPEFEDINKTDTKSEVTFADKQIGDIYNQYLNVKRALVNSSAKMVQIEAKRFRKLIYDTKELELEQLKATVELVSLTKEITKQRDFFIAITEEIEKLLSHAKIESGEIYKQFCPMAFDGMGGYWFSDSEEIRNPYYGDKMLKCGSVQKTIK